MKTRDFMHNLFLSHSFLACNGSVFNTVTCFFVFAAVPPFHNVTMQFAYSDYTQVMLSFHCYNITGHICANFAAALFSRDRRALNPPIWGQIYDILESGNMCVQRRRRYEVTHTVGMYIIPPISFT